MVGKNGKGTKEERKETPTNPGSQPISCVDDVHRSKTPEVRMSKQDSQGSFGTMSDYWVELILVKLEVVVQGSHSRSVIG